MDFVKKHVAQSAAKQLGKELLRGNLSHLTGSLFSGSSKMSYPNSGSNPSYPPYAAGGANPSALGFSGPGMNYQPQQQQMPGYPGYPGGGASTCPAYPPAPSMYPSGPMNPSSAPYSSPYSSNPNSSYPPNPAPYSGGMAPYPGGVPSAPTQQPYGYPQAVSGYPSAPGSGYPAASGSAYPSAPSNVYPSVPSAGYPGTAPGYPSAGAPGYPHAMGMPSGNPMGSVPPSYPSAYGGPQPGMPQSYPSGSGYPTNQGTIRPYPGFDARSDAEVLRKAMKGFGTDEKAIIRILANRTSAQRTQIDLMYKTMYGKDLVDNLKSELSGNLEDVIVALMLPRDQFLAKCLRNAVSGIGTAENTIVEILATATNSEIHQIKAAYQQKYRTSLESDLKSDTSGYFKRLLVAITVGNRNESPQIDRNRAMTDAQALLRAGEGRWGTDESAFTAILVSQSYAQLQVIFQEYERIAHRTIEQTLHSEMSGDLLDGMLTLVKCVRNRIGYFAERLHHSMQGAGTHDNCLIRIIVSRSEIDLRVIKDEYMRMYGRSLESHIGSDTSGDYKKVLLEILSG